MSNAQSTEIYKRLTIDGQPVEITTGGSVQVDGEHRGWITTMFDHYDGRSNTADLRREARLVLGA